MTKRASHPYLKSLFSIKAKVALLCTCSIIIAVTFLFIYLINVYKDSITNNTEITMQSMSTAYSDNLSEMVMQISHSANFMMSSAAISAFVDSEGTKSNSEVEELATMFLNTNSSHEDISLVDENGTVLYSSNSNRIGTNLSNEAYYTEMISTGLNAVSNVYTSESGNPCITFAIPLRTDMQVVGFDAQNVPNSDSELTSSPEDIIPQGDVLNPNIQQTPVEEFTGAIITSVNVSQFNSLLSDINIANYTTGYAFVLDANGTYIYHPKESLIGTKAEVSELATIAAGLFSSDPQSAAEQSSDTITFTEDGSIKYAGYNTVGDNHWLLFLAADQDEILSPLKSATNRSILVSILLAVMLTLIAYLIAGRMTHPIKKITLLIRKTAELDFTEDVKDDALSKGKDETGEMSRAVHQTRSVLKEMILHISEVSNQISLSSDNLTLISNSVNDHVSDNSATAEELSASMEETAATTEQILTSIEQIGTRSKEITDKAAIGANLSSEIILRAEQLRTATESSTVIAKKIYEEVKQRTASALEQSKSVQKINVLTKTIKDISGQTNLLALNASIEAARAGEAGNGFAIVAREIGNLAQQSSSAVHDITEIVQEIYYAVENMSKSMDQTVTFLEQNVLVNYSDFLTSSEKYNTDAKSMSFTMDSIHEQIEMLNTNLHGITNSITEINLMVGEASRGVNDVAEKNSKIVEMSNHTQAMALDNTTHANGLSEIVEKFKLS